MKKNQSGFTLIELVVVMVLLGILAATALPRYIDLTNEARTAAVEGVAGGLASASAINYAGCAAHSNDSSNAKCTQVTVCSEAVALVNGWDTSKYDTTDAAAQTANGVSFTCTVTDQVDNTYTSDATVISAGI